MIYTYSSAFVGLPVGYAMLYLKMIGIRMQLKNNIMEHVEPTSKSCRACKTFVISPVTCTVFWWWDATAVRFGKQIVVADCNMMRRTLVPFSPSNVWWCPAAISISRQTGSDICYTPYTTQKHLTISGDMSHTVQRYHI